MAVKKGQYIRPVEWAKHLRPRGKRQYWSAERLAAKEKISKRQKTTNIKQTPKPRRMKYKGAILGLCVVVILLAVAYAVAYYRPKRNN